MAKHVLRIFKVATRPVYQSKISARDGQGRLVSSFTAVFEHPTIALLGVIKIANAALQMTEFIPSTNIFWVKFGRLSAKRRLRIMQEGQGALLSPECRLVL